MPYNRTLLAAATLVALGAAPAPYAPGLTFSIRSSGSREGAATSVTRVQALGGVLRFDGDPGKQGAGGKGSYTLVNPAAKTLSIVMPDRKQYLEINLADSTGQALGALASMMAATTMVSDIQVSGSALGAGGIVNGYPTNRYRINTSYSEVASDGETPRRVRLVEEFWVTNELKDIPDPMDAFTRAFGGQNGMPQVGGTMSELLRRRGEAKRKLFSGLAIRSVTKSTLVERDGTTSEESSTTEIVDLKRTDLDASALRVPAGFTKTDLKSVFSVGNQMRGALRSSTSRSAGATKGNDSASFADDVASSARDGAKQGVDEAKKETKDAAKDAAHGQVDEAKNKAKCAIGGMFGRKKC
jgi:hypothetical protein